MDSKTVIKPDMAVLRQEQLGLSPFGLLSRLFQEELERRVQQNLGAYAPVPLTLLEEPDQEAATQPVPVSLNLDIHVDAPKSQEEKGKPDPKQEWNKPVEMRILERVQLRERELRETREVLHRLELRLDDRRWNLPPVIRQAERTAAQNRETGRSVVPREAGTPLPLASQAAAVPGAGGWLPRHQQAHPGYPTQEARQEGPTGASILLPDVLRRRREAALAQTEDLPSGWAGTPEEQRREMNPTEELLQFVHQAVEQTMRQNRFREQEARRLVERAVLEHQSPVESGGGQRRSDLEPVSRRPGPAAEAVRPGCPDGGRDAMPASNYRADDTEGQAAASDRISTSILQKAGREAQTAAQDAGMAAVPVERIGASEPAEAFLQNGPETLIYRQTPEDAETAGTAPMRDTSAESIIRGETGGLPTKPAQNAGPNNGNSPAALTASAPSAPETAHPGTWKAAAPSVKPVERRSGLGQMDGEIQLSSAQTAMYGMSPVQTEQRLWASEALDRSESLSDGTRVASRPTAHPAEITEKTPLEEPMVYREADASDMVLPARPVDSAELVSGEGPMAYRSAENIPAEMAGDRMAARIVAEEKNEPIEAPDGSMTARPADSTNIALPEEVTVYREIGIRDKSDSARPVASTITTPSEEPMAHRETGASDAAMPARPVESSEPVPGEEPMVYRSAEKIPTATAGDRMGAQPIPEEKTVPVEIPDGSMTARPAEITNIALPEEATVYRETGIPNERNCARPAGTTETTPPEEPMAHRETGASDTTLSARPVESAKTSPGEEPMVYRETDPSGVALTARPEESAKTAHGEEPMVYRSTEKIPAATADERMAAQIVAGEKTESVEIPDGSITARPAEITNIALPEEATVYRETGIRNESDSARPAASTETTPSKEQMVYREADTSDTAMPARPVESAKTAPGEEPMVYRSAEKIPTATADERMAAQIVAGEKTESVEVPDGSMTARPGDFTNITLPEEATVHRETGIRNESNSARPAETTKTRPPKKPMAYREAGASDTALPARPVESAKTAPGEEPMVYRSAEKIPTATADERMAAQPIPEEKTEPIEVPDGSMTARPAASTNIALPEEAVVYRETGIPNESNSARPVASTEATPPEESMVYRAAEKVPITTEASQTATRPTLKERSEISGGSEVVRTAHPAKSTKTTPPEESVVYRETDLPNENDMARPVETMEPTLPEGSMVYRETDAMNKHDTARPAVSTEPTSPKEPMVYREADVSDTALPVRSVASSEMAPPAQNRLTAARPARHAAGNPAEPDVPLVLRQNGGEETPAAEPFGAAGLRDIRTARPTAGQTAAAEMSWKSGTPTLTFAKTARQQPPEPPEKKPDATQNLPAWARELLEKPPSQTAGSAPSGQSRQIQWTAPQAVPVPAARTGSPANAAAVPPPLLHRERGGEDDLRNSARQAEREAEIRRTADKVYRIIEERLRRELRRSGR